MPRRDASLAARICRWFGRAARDLPWRRRRNGYTALVAEAMLQQTQAGRVEQRFPAFLRRFPTVRRLAEAPEQEVLAEWQGMGYYRRARNLHAAARMIVERFGGRVPRNAEQLRQLPGVGRYTAAAVASIVYGQRVPAVDGNVQRVLARLETRRGRAQDPRFLAWAWERAGTLVDAASSPGVLNEALMELGATVCTPRRPRCAACPVARSCRARRLGRPEAFPAPQRAIRRRVVHHHAVVVRRGARVLLEQRPDNGMWSGMWQVPTVEAARRLGSGELAGRLAVTVGALRAAASFTHHTTHRRITFHVYTAAGRGRKGTWRAIPDTADLPMSNAQRRVLAIAAGR